MFATAGTDPWSGLLLLTLTLLILPVVLLPALVAFLTASTGFRLFGSSTVTNVGSLPAPDETWLWGVAVIAAGWLTWRLARERLVRRAGAATVHAKASTRDSAREKDAMASVFGSPELWSNAGRRWGSGRKKSSKSRERNRSRERGESRLSRLGIQWNWRRPWTVVLSPKVQPQVSSIVVQQATEDYGTPGADLQDYVAEETEEGVTGTEDFGGQEEAPDGGGGEQPVDEDTAMYAAQGYCVNGYTVEAYPQSEQREEAPATEPAFAITVGARGFRSDR